MLWDLFSKFFVMVAYLILSLHYFKEFRNAMKDVGIVKKTIVNKQIQKNKKEVIMHTKLFIRKQDHTAKNLLSRLAL